MSVSEHVRSIINSCSQTLHASRIIRSRVYMNDAELQVTDLLQLLNFYFCFQFLVEVHQRLTGNVWKLSSVVGTVTGQAIRGRREFVS